MLKRIASLLLDPIPPVFQPSRRDFMKLHGALILAFAAALSSGLSAQIRARDTIWPLLPRPRPNIVLIMLDDIGIDKIASYQFTPPGATAPCTPNIDKLAAQGMRFTNAYANPVCSPTRAMLLTGRYAFRTGIGLAIVPGTSTVGLSVDYETTLPEILNGYTSSYIGKWHLSSDDETAGNRQGLQHPLDSGFDFYAGAMFNPDDPPVNCTGCAVPNCGSPLGCSNWVKTVDNGSGTLIQQCTNKYATSDTVDDAIARLRTTPRPFYMQVSVASAHPPLHDPPSTLCHPPGTCSVQNCPAPSGGTVPERFNAMVEAADVEIGRLIRAVRHTDPFAYIILVGDNGTLSLAAEGQSGQCFDTNRSKGTLYEGGVRVPFIVTGPGVAVSENPNLVSVCDLYATIADLTRNPNTADDSVSILPYLRGNMTPLRQTVYSEGFFPNQTTPDHPTTAPFAPAAHIRMVRNTRYKLIRFTDIGGFEDEEFYDLLADPCETTDLCPGVAPCDALQLTPGERLNYVRLVAEMSQLGVF